MGTNKLLVYKLQTLWEFVIKKKQTDKIMILDSLKTQQDKSEPNKIVIE